MSKAAEKIFLGTLFLWVPLVFFMRAADGFTLPREVIACGALAFLVTTVVFSARSGFWKSWSVRLSWSFAGWMILDSWLQAPLKLEVLKGFIHIGLMGGTFLAVVFACSRGFSYVRLLHYAVLAGMLMSLYALIQFFGGDAADWTTRFDNRAFSTLGNPNYLGGHLVALLPIAFLLTLRAATQTGWLWFRAACVLLLAGLFVTKVRGSELALAGSVLFMVAAFFSPWGRPLARKSLRFLLASLGLMLLAGGAFVVKHGGLSSFSFSELSVQQRLDTWKVAWEIVKDHPLAGIGLGQLGFQFPAYAAKPFSPSDYAAHPYFYSEHVHNEFLQFWVEGGPIGLLLFLGWVGSYFTTLVRTLKDPGTSMEDRELLIGISAGLVAILVQSFSNFPLQIAPTAILFGLFMAAPLALGPQEAVGEKTGSMVRWLPVLASFIVMVWGAKALAASVAMRDTVGETSLSSAKAAAYFGGRLTALSPQNPKAWAAAAHALELSQPDPGAFNAYDKALALDPNDVQSLEDEADLQAREGHLDQALQLAQKAQALAPNYSGPYWILAYSHFNLKQYDQAEGYFKGFLNFFPTNDDAYTALGICDLHLGHKEQAEADWEKAVQLNPQDQDAAKFLRSLKRIGGRDGG